MYLGQHALAVTLVAIAFPADLLIEVRRFQAKQLEVVYLTWLLPLSPGLPQSSSLHLQGDTKQHRHGHTAVSQHPLLASSLLELDPLELVSWCNLYPVRYRPLLGPQRLLFSASLSSALVSLIHRKVSHWDSLSQCGQVFHNCSSGSLYSLRVSFVPHLGLCLHSASLLFLSTSCTPRLNDP